MSGQEPIERPWDKPSNSGQSRSGGRVPWKFVIPIVIVLGGIPLVLVWMMPSGSVPDEPPMPEAPVYASSEKFCEQLEAGATPMNLLGEQVKLGRLEPEDAAIRAHGFVQLSCPDELQTNEPLRAYLQNWNINPDA